MVIYEVNVVISTGIFVEYMAWLPGHLKDMLRFKGFLKACYLQEESSSSNEKKITVVFSVATREDLEDYFLNHATRMRAETMCKFKEGFSASRRVLAMIGEVV